MIDGGGQTPQSETGAPKRRRAVNAALHKRLFKLPLLTSGTTAGVKNGGLDSISISDDVRLYTQSVLQSDLHERFLS